MPTWRAYQREKRGLAIHCVLVQRTYWFFGFSRWPSCTTRTNLFEAIRRLGDETVESSHDHRPMVVTWKRDRRRLDHCSAEAIHALLWHFMLGGKRSLESRVALALRGSGRTACECQHRLKLQSATFTAGITGVYVTITT